MLPGTGATAATFISYAEAKRRAPNPEAFGKGEPSGLIASESSNNAVSGGAMVPMLSLGIPGDGGTVVMLGALTIHNVIPGVRLFQEQPHLVTLIFVLLFVANVFMLVLGAAGASVYSRLLRIPVTLLMPLVLMLCIVGAYAIRSNPVDLVVVMVFGIIGFLLRLNSFPAAPIIIGFILGAPLERNLRQGLILTDTNFLSFFASPIASILFAVTGLMLLNLFGLGRLLSSRLSKKSGDKKVARDQDILYPSPLPVHLDRGADPSSFLLVYGAEELLGPEGPPAALDPLRLDLAGRLYSHCRRNRADFAFR